MIPVRVPADARPVLASERLITMDTGHPLYFSSCPVCGDMLGDRKSVLILAGIRPEDRQPPGMVTGAGVTVHAACAGYE